MNLGSVCRPQVRGWEAPTLLGSLESGMDAVEKKKESFAPAGSLTLSVQPPLNSVALVRERPPLVGEVSANLCGLRVVVSAADPYGRNLCFLDRSRYYFFQVAPQLYSRG
jgi:hypothetical protein